MIYIQSFFNLPPVTRRKGKAFSIANSIPHRVEVDSTVECLVPPWSIVRDFKAQRITWEEYTDYYYHHLHENWQPVKAWLQSLSDTEDIYLCCWERSPKHCHRSLVAELIRKHRPDIEVQPGQCLVYTNQRKEPIMATDYTIVFDGGSKGNGSPDAKAYGSYLIQARDGRERISRLDFPNGDTNNEAEYKSLIAGLEDLVRVIEAAGKSPGDYTVTALGDSQVVTKQVTGEWKCKASNLIPLYQQAQELLAQFGEWNLAWQPREQTVAVLGH